VYMERKFSPISSSSSSAETAAETASSSAKGENNNNYEKKGGAWERCGIHSLSDAKIQKQQQRFKTTTFEEEEEKGEGEDGREAGSSFLSYLGFNEKQTDDSVFQERLKPRYQAAGSRDSCGLFSLGRGWQELYAARQGCGGSSRGGGGGAFEDEEDEEDENTRNNNNTNTTKKKTTTKSSYFFSPKTSTKKARERFSQTPRKREEGKHEDGSSSSVF